MTTEERIVAVYRDHGVTLDDLYERFGPIGYGRRRLKGILKRAGVAIDSGRRSFAGSANAGRALGDRKTVWKEA